MFISIEQLKQASLKTPNMANLESAHYGYMEYAGNFGLDQVHRAVPYFANLMHESGDFVYDRELWGPTPAQKRYEGREDLGNTQTGDGKRFMGRTAMQLTGRHNYGRFTEFVQLELRYPNAPDFTDKPELVNTDPWEGIVPMWFWDRGNSTGRSLNRYADQNNMEMITRKINGGLNGFDDRLRRYTRLGLVVLGYGPNDRRAFQKDAKAKGFYTGELDGQDGPLTRAAIHKSLLAMTPKAEQSDKVQSSPVVEEKPVVPPPLDKPISKTTGLWERIVQVVLGGGVAGAAAFLDDWKVVAVLGAVVIVVAVGGIFLHKRIYDAVQSFRKLRE